MSISQSNTGYRFGATYVGSNQTGPNESFPVLLGDMDLQGNTAGTILHQIGKYRMKFQGQVQVYF
jgi:mitochondrial import receptor subunit TOM40